MHLEYLIFYKQTCFFTFYLKVSSCMEELCILSFQLCKASFLFLVSSLLFTVEFMATQSVMAKDQAITAVYDSHFQCFRDVANQLHISKAAPQN